MEIYGQKHTCQNIQVVCDKVIELNEPSGHPKLDPNIFITVPRDVQTFDGARSSVDTMLMK